MAYSSDYTRQLFDKDCKLLIKAITNFDEEEENFKVCLDFTLSNLLYHSYLDINSHKINRSVSGLHEKYLIHSDLEKARTLKFISDKLLDTFNKKHGSQKDTAYRVLSLLLYLSESCSAQPILESTSFCSGSLETDEKSVIDWATYLREGDEKYVLSDTSSETFSSEEDSVDDMDCKYLNIPPPRDDSGLGISPDSCSGGSQQQFHVNSNYLLPTQDDLAKTPEDFVPVNDLFYCYWMSKYQQTFTSNPYNLITVNFTKTWETHTVAQDPLLITPFFTKKVIMHERNVVKEILWMLSCVKDLFLFQWNGYEFIVNPAVHLCNLTSMSLGEALKDFCDYGAKRVFLCNFVEEALLEDPCGPNFCLAFHTYASALQEQLQKISCFFCDLEKRLRMRKETFTLLNLMEKCKYILSDLDTIYYLNHDILEDISISCSPYEKACRLLHILWKHLFHQSLREQSSSSVKIILTVFLKACKPFFTFLESLIIQANFKDVHGEFICTRKENIEATDSEFWENGLMLKNLPSDLENNFFLKPFLKDIVVAGKSIEILNKMYSLMKIEPFRLHVEKGELYSKFIRIILKLFNKEIAAEIYSNSSSSCIEEDFHVVCDPLLDQKIFRYQSTTEKFFRPDINPVYLPIEKTPPVKLYTEMQICTENAIEYLNAKSLKPLNISIINAFDKCMKYAYYPTCRRLVKALKEKYSLMTHINVMQKYFLMESGHLMFSFYSKLFEKMFYNEPWKDVSFLYSVLQNAIAEDKENCQNLCVFLDTSNPEIQTLQPLSHLYALQLSYEVEWPVSIMLGSTVQNQYCQIFSFLLQIKAAKYLLDELQFNNLYDKVHQNKLASLMSKSVFPRQQKIHGMYIIRMRLMYFVNGLHNYIMTRILHSFGLDFISLLENARTVDDMIVAHNSYLKSLHERCFLDRRLPYLREQIFQVLNLSYNFHQLWLKGVDSIGLEELENIEIQFSKYSTCLFCYFNTPLRRGVYFHLESLVSSMLSETHDLHVFKLKGHL